VNRKKNILREIKKQLESSKKKLIIVLNKNYQIKKDYPQAILEKIVNFRPRPKKLL
jgi:hypothetical protein